MLRTIIINEKCYDKGRSSLGSAHVDSDVIKQEAHFTEL